MRFVEVGFQKFSRSNLTFAIVLINLLIVSAVYAQSTQKIILDKTEDRSGYYLVVEPESKKIDGVLVLLPGFGLRAESILSESDLHNVSFSNRILTVMFAPGDKLYADSEVQSRMNAVLAHVIRKYQVDPEKIVLGGYSAGGTVATRYVELCHEFPEKYPVQPEGVFTVDSPLDIFRIWDYLEEAYDNRYTEAAYREAEFVMRHMKSEHGVPRENMELYAKLTPFSMNKSISQNEKHLKDVAVRVYHDVDIEWRLKNSTQSVRDSNYLVSSELIKRLLLMGNDRAEFKQSFQTGYRSDGRRHPHSWSIVDEQECIEWLKHLFE